MRLAGVVRSFAMRPFRRLLVLLALALPTAARADSAPPDSGRFIVFQGDMPVANEKFVFQFLGDSLALTAVSRRTMQDEQGQRHNFVKTMLLVADVRDHLEQREHRAIHDVEPAGRLHQPVRFASAVLLEVERDGRVPGNERALDDVAAELLL